MLLPFVGPLAGLALVWASPRWTRRQKLVVTAIVVALLALPLLALFAFLARADELDAVSQLVPLVPLARIGPAILRVGSLVRGRP